MNLLLVEDDPGDILFLRKALNKVLPGIAIEVVQDGDAAVEFLSHTRPSHVLLDLKLPKRTGLEVLEWIRARKGLETLPVVIVTSSGEAPDRKRSAELGVAGYRVKPVSYSELVVLVREILSAWGLLGKAS